MGRLVAAQERAVAALDEATEEFEQGMWDPDDVDALLPPEMVGQPGARETMAAMLADPVAVERELGE